MILCKSTILDIRGVIQANQKASKWKDFDWDLEQGMEMSGINYRTNRLQILNHKGQSTYYQILYQIRQSIIEKCLMSPLFLNDSQWRKTFLAMILGEKSLIPEKSEVLFKLSGTMHIFFIHRNFVN